MQRRLIDTNILVRYLMQDHERHSAVATALFERCDRGELSFLLLPEVLSECVFVLESTYQRPRQAIAEALSILIANSGIELDDVNVHIDALARYGKSRMHFVDCLLAAHASARGIAVASFDAGFRKFSDVRVEV